MADILIIDDEADIRDLVSGILEDDGHQVRTARDSDEALDAVRRRRPSLVVLDIWLQGSRIDGLELLAMFKEIDPDLPVIVISGHGTIETAVAAINESFFAGAAPVAAGSPGLGAVPADAGDLQERGACEGMRAKHVSLTPSRRR